MQSWATELADLQPLVLVFEDVHWAEEPMLDLIEHLASSVRDVPLMIVCLARGDLLDSRPSWGGGKVRSTSIELEPLPRPDGARLVTALAAGGEHELLSPDQRDAVLETTDGNPLFIEETVRMLLESDGAPSGIPATVQAMISARIDRLPHTERAVLRRAAVAGRGFWSGVIDALGDGEPSGDALEELVARDFLLREARSTIRGEQSYRFKHVLIRDVAYTGLSKSSRAVLHREVAHWLSGRAVADELVEIRAYHLDHAADLEAELQGAVPADLAAEAAAALEQAGRRSLAREANAPARRLFVRAVELEPNLERRYLAARCAWRMTDIPTVHVEMRQVADAAHAAGDAPIATRALTVLAQVALYRDGDSDRARELAAQALEVVGPTDEVGRFDALEVLGIIYWWEGDLDEMERLATERLAIAEALGRTDLEISVLLELNDVNNQRLETELARPPLERARQLAELSASPTTRGWVLRAIGRQATIDNRLNEAEAALEEARELFAESGAALTLGRALNFLGVVHWRRGDLGHAESVLREAIRVLTPLQDRGTLVETQRMLSQVLLESGRLDEAERFAVAARTTVGSCDISSDSTTRLALGLVRAAQGEDEEAERLLRESEEILRPTGYRRHRIAPLEALAGFLRARGREDEACEVERALAELLGEPAAA
jgi:tetratricopeptide (TPR) repeat protein